VKKLGCVPDKFEGVRGSTGSKRRMMNKVLKKTDRKERGACKKILTTLTFVYS